MAEATASNRLMRWSGLVANLRPATHASTPSPERDSAFRVMSSTAARFMCASNGVPRYSPRSPGAEREWWDRHKKGDNHELRLRRLTEHRESDPDPQHCRMINSFCWI